MAVELRRNGVLVAAYGVQPAALEAMQWYMTYDRKELVQERGKSKTVTSTYRQWYVQEDGAIVFPVGFVPRVCGIIAAYGDVVSRYFRRDRSDALRLDLSRVNCTGLRPEQVQMLQAVDGNEGGQLISPTGSGKSYGMQEICAMYPEASIIICAPGRETVSTMCRYLQERFGKDGVGQVGGGKRHTRRITVSTFNSILRVDNVEKVDILLADEGHRTPAVLFERNLMAVTSPLKRFMFTATPEGRYDNAELVMESLFGPQLVNIPFQQSVANGSVLPVHIIVKDQPHGPSDAELRRYPAGPFRDRVAIWRNNKRNDMIAKDVQEVMSTYDDPQVLVLVDKTEHALILHKYLPDFELVHGTVDAGRRAQFKKQALLGEDDKMLTPSERDAVRKRFESGESRRVLATQVFATGVSADQCQIVAIASGSGSVIQFLQSLGRAARKSDATGKTHATAMIWRDTFSFAYTGRATRLIDAATREQHYITRVPCQR